MFLWLLQLTLTQKHISSVRLLHMETLVLVALALAAAAVATRPCRIHFLTTINSQPSLANIRLTTKINIADCDLPYRPYKQPQTTRQDGETRTRRWWKGAAAANQLHFQAPSDPRKGLDMVVRTARHPYRGYYQGALCCHTASSARILITYTGFR